MQVNWEFTGCEESDEVHFEQLWHQRALQLEAKGANWEDPSSHLLISIEYERDDNEWRALTVLYLAERTVTTEQTANSPDALMDQIVSALSQAIDVQAEVIEKMPERGRLQNLEQITSTLEEYRTQKNSGSFMTRLTPIVQRLRSYTDHEIRIRQRMGELNAEQIETRDVLDEILVRAWDRFSQRPRQTPLDLWLLNLIDDMIDELGHQVAEESLQDDRPVEIDGTIQSQEDQWTEQVSYPETIHFAELLPGEPGIESLDEVDAETRRTRLTELLGALPRSQRQALLLHTNYGYNDAEIADFQTRGIEEVQADLTAARETLRRELEERDWWDAQERFERASLRHKQQSHP